MAAGGRPRVPGARRVVVTVRLSEGEAERLDRARGGESRSAWAARVLVMVLDGGLRVAERGRAEDVQPFGARAGITPLSKADQAARKRDRG